MKTSIGILALSLLLLSCQDRKEPTPSPSLKGGEMEGVYQQPDTTGAYPQPLPKAGENQKVSSTPTSSNSSHSYESSSYDNMRGFDPASEDDMDDNGMSSYMENNDDAGWN